MAEAERVFDECSCYVQRLDAATRFVLHFGAHNPACRAYRKSLDPVDHSHDLAFRLRYDR